MKLRKITSLSALVSFLMLVASSIVLYLSPQGRVAYWADWRLWGLSRTEWANIHLNLGLLLLLTTAVHIYYNWKPITSYLKNKARQVKVFTAEFNLALAITAAFILGTYFLAPPFSWVLDGADALKAAAARKYGEPPYGHAELTPLEKVPPGLSLKCKGLPVQEVHAFLLFLNTDSKTYNKTCT